MCLKDDSKMGRTDKDVQWNAVELWSRDIVVDNCAIFRNNMMELCLSSIFPLLLLLLLLLPSPYHSSWFSSPTPFFGYTA